MSKACSTSDLGTVVLVLIFTIPFHGVASMTNGNPLGRGFEVD
jgi:hypothetical protein